MTVSTTSLNRRYFYAIGVLLLVSIWQLMSNHYPEVLVPSPWETGQALLRIYQSGDLIANLAITFRRQLTGLGLGLLAGLASGLLAGALPRLELILQPLVSLLLAIPAIILAVMAMVWFGMGSNMAIFLVALLVFPIMHTNTVEGLKSIDPALIEMSRVYRLPLPLALRKIYLPGMLHSLIAGFSLSMASSIRLTVMAELLGAREGMGRQIATARSYLETAELFAWVLILLTILAGLEFLLIRPLRRWSSRSMSESS